MGGMEIGISTASFFPKLYTEEALPHIAALGAKVCEVFYASRCEYAPDFADKVAEGLSACGLRAHSVHALTTQFEPELFSRNDRALSYAYEVCEALLGSAKRIGAHFYTFHGPMMLKRTKYVFDYGFLAEKLNALCGVAQKYDVQVCYETVHWAYFNTPRYFAELSSRCPSLGAVLDVKQTMQTGLGYEPFLDAIGDRLRTVHLCDFDADGGLRLPGRGSFDFVTLFKRLKDSGYDGPCLMEVYTNNYDKEGALKDAFDHLLECEAKAVTA